jgi:hypothetical protein
MFSAGDHPKTVNRPSCEATSAIACCWSWNHQVTRETIQLFNDDRLDAIGVQHSEHFRSRGVIHRLNRSRDAFLAELSAILKSFTAPQSLIAARWRVKPSPFN